MKTSNIGTNSGRRTMLAGSGALFAAGVALLATTPPQAADDQDAELLALCARAEGLYRQIHDLFPGGATPIADDSEREAALAPLYATESRIAGEIFDIEATTLAGHRARARCILAAHEGLDLFQSTAAKSGPEGAVLAALVRDLVGARAI